MEGYVAIVSEGGEIEQFAKRGDGNVRLAAVVRLKRHANW